MRETQENVVMIENQNKDGILGILDLIGAKNSCQSFILFKNIFTCHEDCNCFTHCCKSHVRVHFSAKTAQWERLSKIDHISKAPKYNQE